VDEPETTYKLLRLQTDAEYPSGRERADEGSLCSREALPASRKDQLTASLTSSDASLSSWWRRDRVTDGTERLPPTRSRLRPFILRYCQYPYSDLTYWLNCVLGCVGLSVT
jgi:hypothetical protein